MLTKIFSSQVRVKILKMLIMHERRSFSVAEIASVTNSIVRSVNKEIVKLIETGIVIEELKDTEVNKKRVKVKHYRINKHFIIFEEIKSIFLKLQVIELDNFKEKISKLGNINYVVLTGNFIGNPKVKIDLLIVGEASKKKMDNFIKDLQKILGWEINWTQMNLPEYDYRKQIGDMFLFDILSSNKIEIYSKFV